VKGVVSDLLEALSPIKAVACKDTYIGIGDMLLLPVAVELDLMKPTVSARLSRDCGSQRRLNKPGVRRLDANRFPPSCPGARSDQPQRQLPVMAFVPLYEALQA
jgi:hypothetical protein